MQRLVELRGNKYPLVTATICPQKGKARWVGVGSGRVGVGGGRMGVGGGRVGVGGADGCER